MSLIKRSVNMVLAESATVCPLLVGGGRSLNPPALVGGSGVVRFNSALGLLDSTISSRPQYYKQDQIQTI
jgi:hypothetical protein